MEEVDCPRLYTANTYDDKVDDTVMVENILMNVHGQRGAHHGLQEEAMFCDVWVHALISLLLLLLLLLLNAGVS